jgi:DNA-binding MarR family transcriptional regulator
MDSEIIKESFLRVKEDIASLVNEVSYLKSEIEDIKSLLDYFHERLEYFNSKNSFSTQNPTIQHINPTDLHNTTDNPTVPQEIGGLKNQFLGISTGNRGVPTDSQTDNQTDQQTQNLPDFPENTRGLNSPQSIETNIKEAKMMFDSLDKLKKQIRLKFRLITPQEMIVFSTIYQLEETDPDFVTYKEISKRLNLSESSIRDYVQRIIQKGIPIRKSKINNKKVILSISPELKKIATLSTILQLREL